MAGTRSRSQDQNTSGAGRRSATGITNRGLGEELGEQMALPPRGGRKLRTGIDRPVEPAAKKQRGRRRGEPGADVAVSRRTQGSAGQPLTAYGRSAKGRPPVSPRVARSTAAPGARAKIRKPNRKTAR